MRLIHLSSIESRGMVGGPNWTEQALKEYARNNSPDLDWLKKPGRHQFRWRTLKGRWITSKRRIKDHNSLLKALRNDAPLDIYVSTSEWLNPIDLPRLSDNEKPHPILLDHLIVFDIDMEPFSKRKLEMARKSAIQLIDWIEENESGIHFSHATFSGSKGFHIFYRDEDIGKFSIGNPKEREAIVKKERKNLLERVIQAGHPVDPLVTADTRRIIRVPGTIHGGTGWICTRIDINTLRKPLNIWINSIPRHKLSNRIPRWGFSLGQRKKSNRKKKKGAHLKQNNPSSIHLEVSTQVPGTKDRNSIMIRIKGSSGKITERIEKFVDMMDRSNIGPCAIWTDEEGALLLIPRAFPSNAIRKISKEIGMNGLGYSIKKKGHAWIRITPSNSELLSGELIPRGIFAHDSGKRCKHPWSTAHLLFSEQMGISFAVDHEVAGTPQISSRIVRIR